MQENVSKPLWIYADIHCFMIFVRDHQRSSTNSGIYFVIARVPESSSL